MKKDLVEIYRDYENFLDEEDLVPTISGKSLGLLILRMEHNLKHYK